MVFTGSSSARREERIAELCIAWGEYSFQRGFVCSHNIEGVDIEVDCTKKRRKKEKAVQVKIQIKSQTKLAVEFISSLTQFYVYFSPTQPYLNGMAYLCSEKSRQARPHLCWYD